MMLLRKNIPLFVLFLVCFGCNFSSSAKAHKFDDRFDRARLTKSPPFISVMGHRFTDEDDEVFLFKGMSIADPDKLFEEGQWNKKIFTELHLWGANTVRLPVHPASWRKRGVQNYVKLLDQAIVWANEVGLYVIIDWHSIGHLSQGLFARPDYKTTVAETHHFWRIISHRYKGISTVALYELFNEPSRLGKNIDANWSQWKHLNESLIDIIYKEDTRVIPLVAGFDWAYDLTPIKHQPIDRPGIGYVSHPYPQKADLKPLAKRTYFNRWNNAWGYVAKTYPVIATEIGWVEEGGFGAHIPVLNNGAYGPIIIEYLNKHGISWIGWAFDPSWSPVMIKSWDFEPSAQGAFFKNVLQGKQ